jgi:hypothetical protein
MIPRSHLAYPRNLQHRIVEPLGDDSDRPLERECLVGRRCGDDDVTEVKLLAQGLRRPNKPRLPSSAHGLMFGRSPTGPFDPSVSTERAYRAWDRAGLERYSLHEARHTYVTFLHAAGVHLKAVSTFAGHTSISTALDRYAHLLPGTERETAQQLDELLAPRAPTGAAARGGSAPGTQTTDGSHTCHGAREAASRSPRTRARGRGESGAKDAVGGG